MPDTESTGKVAAYLAGAKNRAEAVTMPFSPHRCCELSQADTPRLLAAVERVLARHKPGDGTAEIHTLEKGWHSVTACAGCEEPWPCPDYKAISAALLGEDGSGGDRS